MDDLIIPTFAAYAAAQMPKTRAELIREYIAAHPAAKSPEIADALQVPRCNVTSQITELVRAGLIFRAGLRADYVHFADEASCVAAADKIAAEQTAERKAKKRAYIKRHTEAKARERAARIAAGEIPKRKPQAKKPREQRLEGRVEAYLRKHQGCASKDVCTGAGIVKSSVVWALGELIKEGVVWRVGELGSNGCHYFTDRAAYDKAQAEHDARKAQEQAAREKAAADTHAAARKKVADAAQRRAEAESAKAARKLQKAAAAAAKAELAKAKAEKRAEAEAARKREAARKAASVNLAPARAKTQPSVNLSPWPSSAEARETEKTVRTVVAAPRGPFEVNLKPGEGAISQDWLARRAGKPIPSRFNGVYA